MSDAPKLFNYFQMKKKNEINFVFAEFISITNALTIFKDDFLKIMMSSQSKFHTGVKCVFNENAVIISENVDMKYLLPLCYINSKL